MPRKAKVLLGCLSRMMIGMFGLWLTHHMDMYSTPLTEDWYTLRRRLHSPAMNTGLMIFCVLIISRNSGKLCTRHENFPLALLSPPPELTCRHEAHGLEGQHDTSGVCGSVYVPMQSGLLTTWALRRQARKAQGPTDTRAVPLALLASSASRVKETLSSSTRMSADTISVSLTA